MQDNQELLEAIQNASDQRIREIIKRKNDYNPDAVKFAEAEWIKRNLQEEPRAVTESKKLPPPLWEIKLKRYPYNKLSSQTQLLDSPESSHALPAYLRVFALLMFLQYFYLNSTVISLFFENFAYHNLEIIIFSAFRAILSCIPLIAYGLLFFGYRISWFLILLQTLNMAIEFFSHFHRLRFMHFDDPGLEEVIFVLQFLVIIVSLYLLHKSKVLKTFEITPGLRYKSYLASVIFALLLFYLNKSFSLTF